MTIKELNKELDLRTKNKVINEISDFIDYLEAIGADEMVLLSTSNVLLNGTKAKEYKNFITNFLTYVNYKTCYDLLVGKTR